MKFNNLAEARQALLCDAVKIARSSGERFAVVGGWSPYLLNSKPIRHPGTADVDLLFAEGVTPGQLQQAYRLFLDAGYYPSAKHEFQLVWLTIVGSQELAFNVDILHPHEQTRRELFVDHIELPVPMTPFIKRHLKLKSVVIPASRFVFTFNRVVEVEVQSISPSGVQPTSVPVIDEAGLLVTKSHSFKNPKRKRDLFDIYLAIIQCRNRREITEFLRRLKKADADTFNTLYSIERGILDNPELLRNINEYLPESNRQSDSALRTVLVEFLREAGVEAVKSAKMKEFTRIE